MSSKIYSAIDVGSNAIRLIIAELKPNSPIKVLKKVRVPIRLGHDVFIDGKISSKNLLLAEQAFLRFRDLHHKFHVAEFRAVATSATREASNKSEFVQHIEQKTGIKLNIIDGTLEGQLVHKAITHELNLNGKKAMGIDIGGGSVEITFSENDSIKSTQSFPLGTVRLLEKLHKNNVDENHLPIFIGQLMKPLSEHIHKFVDHHKLDFAIGTGGNLECLGRLKIQMLKKTPNTFVTLSEIQQILNGLKKLTYKQRIEKLDMKPDRADVIVPACEVVLTAMTQAEVERLLIPGVGLRDGILWSLFETKAPQSF